MYNLKDHFALRKINGVLTSALIGISFAALNQATQVKADAQPVKTEAVSANNAANDTNQTAEKTQNLAVKQDVNANAQALNTQKTVNTNNENTQFSNHHKPVHITPPLEIHHKDGSTNLYNINGQKGNDAVLNNNADRNEGGVIIHDDGSITVPGKDGTPGENDQIDINYEPNKQQLKIHFLDTMDNNREVHVQTVTGLTDKSTTLSYETPANYVLTSDPNRPTSYTFTANSNQSMNVYVTHQTKTPSPNDKDGNEIIDYLTNINRQYRIYDELPSNYGGEHLVKTYNLAWYRSVSQDLVTHAFSYGTWYAANDDSKAIYNEPGTGFNPNLANNPQNIAGYTLHKANANIAPRGLANKGNSSHGLIDALIPSQDFKNTYTANNQSSSFQFVDDDNNGNVVKTTPVNGVTDQTVNVTLTTPTGYDLVGIMPHSYTFKASGNDAVKIHVKHHHETPSETEIDPTTNKTIHDMTHISRTYTINDDRPGKYGGKHTVRTYNLAWHRSADKDDANGHITYGKWVGDNNDSSNLYDEAKGISHTYLTNNPEVITGYTQHTPAFANTPAQTGNAVHASYNIAINSFINNNAGNALLNAFAPSAMLDNTYTADSQRSSFIFYDDDDKHNIGSSVVINGTTDSTVNINPVLPANYHLTSGSMPTTYSFNNEQRNGSWVTHTDQLVIHVEHNIITPSGDTKDPDNGNETVSELTHQERVYKTVVTGLPTKYLQHGVNYHDMELTFNRNAHQDAVTKKITYDKWIVTNSDDPNAQAKFDTDGSILPYGRKEYGIIDSDNGEEDSLEYFYDVQVTNSLGGNKDDIASSLDMKNINPVNLPASHTITYDFVPDTIDISYQYLDQSSGDNVIKVGAISGLVDTTNNTNLTIPEGYKLANGQTLPTRHDFTLQANGKNGQGLTKWTLDLDTLTFYFVHQILQGSSGDHLDIEGATPEDLTNTSTRTFHINYPADYTGTAPREITQTIIFHRTVQIDDHLHKIVPDTYSAWKADGGTGWHFVKDVPYFDAVTAPAIAGYTGRVVPDKKNNANKIELIYIPTIKQK